MATGTSGIGQTPRTLGGAINVQDSTALALLDVTGLTLGTRVYNSAVGADFQLTVSSASLSSTVVAVAGTTGMRWISQGAVGGFVTLAQLADTTLANAGANLIGVYSNGGMFSEPDLQHVLQEDVVLKAALAAVDGSGGASLVGIQDTGGFFTGTNVESALQQIGTSLAAGGFQTVANPTAFTGTLGHAVEFDLSDNLTTTQAITGLTVHTTSGTAAAGFGSVNKNQLENASGTTKDASSLITQWVTATNAAEDSSLSVQAMRGGSMVTLAKFSGKASGVNDAPLVISLGGGTNGETAIQFNQNGHQEITKSGSGDISMRAVAGAAVYLGSSVGSKVYVSEEFSGFSNVLLGASDAISNAVVDGFTYIGGMMTAAGTVPGTPAHDTGSGGNYTNKIPMVFNHPDNKLLAWMNSQWRSVTFIQTPTTLGATLTNSVTSGGTTNTVSDVVAAAVDTSAASLVSTRNAIYQLALKLRNIELAVKQNTSMGIT